MSKLFDEITLSVMHARAILDMAEEYALSEQVDRSDSEKMADIIFAVTTARDKVRAVETALLNYHT